MSTTCRTTPENVTPVMLAGFFAGWPSPPSPETHLRILRHSDAVVLAVDEEAGREAGFITAIIDPGRGCRCCRSAALAPVR